jgi:hypothetical protein
MATPVQAPGTRVPMASRTKPPRVAHVADYGAARMDLGAARPDHGVARRDRATARPDR